MTDLREAAQMALDALIDAADSQNWEMQQNIDQHGEWYRRSVNLKQSTTKSQAAIEALRARLAQPEPEPVACDGHFPEGFSASSGIPAQALRAANAIMCDVMGERYWDVSCTAKHLLDFAYSYTAPPQREWQGLTENEIKHLWYEACQTNLELTSQLIVHLARNIEAKLKEKNT